MDVYEMAKRNYGRTWTKEMLAALVQKGLDNPDKVILTPEQYEEITGEVYGGGGAA